MVQFLIFYIKVSLMLYLYISVLIVSGLFHIVLVLLMQVYLVLINALRPDVKLGLMYVRYRFLDVSSDGILFTE